MMQYEKVFAAELEVMPQHDQAFFLKRWPTLMERLQKSASGYIRTIRFSNRDRLAMKYLIGAGLVEFIDNPGEKGRAYKARQQD